MQSPDMRHPVLRLARVLLGGLLLVAGAPDVLAHPAPGDTIVQSKPSPTLRGGDGVGGIEKNGGHKAPAPVPPVGGTPAANPVDAEPASESTWEDLGGGLPGTGTPTLSGAGGDAPGTDIALDLLDGRPLALTTLVLGTEAADLPFKGGTLVPVPMLLVGGLLTDAEGGLHLQATLPDNLPAGITLCVQLWTVDPQAPQGLSASNAVQLVVP